MGCVGGLRALKKRSGCGCYVIILTNEEERGYVSDLLKQQTNRLIFDGIPSRFQASLPYLPSVKASRYVEQASNTFRFSL